jgi:hypothetical protein
MVISISNRRLTTGTAHVAHLHPTSITNSIRCSALHWEAPHEIYFGEWQDALSAILLRDVRSAYRRTLSAGGRDAPHLLRSRLLCGSLQKRRPAPRKSGQGTMNTCSHTYRAVPWQQAELHRSLPAGKSDGLASLHRAPERDGVIDGMCRTISQFGHRWPVHAIGERTLQ